jgi:DNA-binding transcriptional MerR regulator
MKYTVQKLAKISGVSVRTLHWYYEIGLLKPAHVLENGYRIYEEEQLLTLQQILFFRELGFKLTDIKKILASSDFDKVHALETHRKTLDASMRRLKKLRTTIDTTLTHLKGEMKMQDTQLFEGFDVKKQKEYEDYIRNRYGQQAEKYIEQASRNTKNWTKDDWNDVKAEGDAIHKALVKCIQEGLAPESEPVQEIINRHYHLIERFYEVDKELYVGLAQLYADHPDFRNMYDSYHPELVDFLGEAMRVYAKMHLNG